MATSENFIKQIQAGAQTYDIAVAHGLTFTTGANTQVWDGVSDVEVVIPTLSDLVSSPIVFAGTVGSNGTISWASGYRAPAQKGYLVYITADCTFDGKSCEAGDMAVCTGVENDTPIWSVISGENQVTIKAGTTPASGATEVVLSATAKSVLDVEGKELALKLPTTLLTGVNVTKNTANQISFDKGAAADVEAKWITLTYTSAAEDTTISTDEAKEEATTETTNDDTEQKEEIKEENTEE